MTAPGFLDGFLGKVLPERLDAAARLWSRLGPSADDDLIHDLRVSVRRLGWELRALGLDAGLKRAAAEGRTVERALSPVRNADVSMGWAETLAGRSRDSMSGKAGRFFRRRQKASRARKLRRCLAALSDMEPYRWRDATRRALDALRSRVSIDASARAALDYGKVLKAAASRVDLRLGGLEADSSDGRWHEARKALRELRYGLDDARAVAGRPEARLLRLLVERQTLLGEAHDMSVLKRKLRRALAAAPRELCSPLEDLKRAADEERRRRLEEFCARRDDAVWWRAAETF